MSRIRSNWVGPAVWLLACAAALPSHAETRPDVRLDGDWQLDVAASDNFDDKLAKLAEAMRAKRKARRGGAANGGFGGRGAGGRGDGSDGDGALDANGVPLLSNELPPESRDELRDRLGETFRPPQHLQIHTGDDEVRMLGDAPPERRYNLLETVTRMDLSGTSTLRSSWTSQGLLVDSRYTNRSRSIQRYTLDRTGTVLNVSLDLTEPISGRLQVHSVYRRAPGPAAAGSAAPTPPLH